MKNQFTKWFAVIAVANVKFLFNLMPTDQYIAENAGQPIDLKIIIKEKQHINQIIFIQ